ncbi:MAG: carbon-nitrogen hydrolase family protein [Mariniphaga sp.]|nr:carbon-nitrogen hydrolase family protein [Mariniphaga sp.]MDD4224761.1 carbon-nitrogen hydrolase family protein [Mariniphaga sp.]
MKFIKFLYFGLLFLSTHQVISQVNYTNQVKSRLKLAMVQMLVEGGNPEANLDRAVARIEITAGNGADLVLLPEALDLGWTHSSARVKAGSIPGGSTFKKLANAAKKNRVYVCAGIIEKDGEKIFNSAVIISPKGELLLKHRKINELDIAHDIYSQGDRINVCETEFGTFGLLICADARAKDFMLARSMGYLGADLILLPSSWAVQPDYDNNKTPYGGGWLEAFNAVCREFHLSIAAVSNVGLITDGPWKDWLCIGNSIYMGSGAKATQIMPYGADADTIFYQDVVLYKRPARGNSWPGFWRAEKD